MRRAFVGLLIGIAIAVAASGPVARCAAEPETIPEFHFVYLRNEQAAEHLAKVPTGVLRAMPRHAFDDLIHRARARSTSEPATLLATRAGAVLRGIDLVGTASWSIRGGASLPHLLDVEPLQIAVAHARWSDGPSAELGQLVGAQTGAKLLVDRAGERTLNFDWSLHGRQTPEGTRFNLSFPRCAIATLDLELPAEIEPTLMAGDAMLTGPIVSNGLQRWRIAYSGCDGVELLLAPTAASHGATVRGIRSRQDVSSTQTACEFAIEVRTPASGIREFAFDCDAAFEPLEVVASNMSRWKMQPGVPRRLLLQWRQPFFGGEITVKGRVPQSGDSSWISPSLTPRCEGVHGEKLTVHVLPGVRLDDWRPGAFRIIDAAASTDRGQTIVTIADAIRTNGGRPSGRVRTMPAAVEPDVGRAPAKPIAPPKTEKTPVNATGTCEVSIVSGTVRATHRMRIDPNGHWLEALLLTTLDAAPELPKWRVTNGRTAIRSIDDWTIDPGVIGQSDPWGMLLSLAPIAARHCIRFTSPVETPIELECQSEQSLPKDHGWVISLPLYQFATNGRVNWSVIVESSSIAYCESRPSHMATTPGRPDPDSSGRRLFTVGPALGLKAWVWKESVRVHDAHWTIDSCHPDRIESRYSLSASSNPGSRIYLTLPTDAAGIVAEFNGVRTEWQAAAAPASTIALLPPAGDRWRLELHYHQPHARGQFFDRLSVSCPASMHFVAIPTVSWRLPADWLPTPTVDWMRQTIDGPGDDDDRGVLWRQTKSRETEFASYRPATCGWLVTLAIGGLFAGAFTFTNRIGLTRVLLIAGFAIGSGAIIFLVLVGGPIVAESPAPVLIGVIPDPASRFENDTLLIPAALHRQLEDSAAEQRAGILVNEAEYTGRLEGTKAVIQARFLAHNLGESPATLSLPFDGGRLISATVDDKPAFPAVKKEHLSIPLPNRGAHRVELQFEMACPLAKNREVRFRTPETPSSRLVFQAPGDSKDLHVANVAGSQSTELWQGGQRLTADIGRSREIVIRLSSGSAARPPIVRAQESYLWDFDEASVRLFGDLRFQIDGGVEQLAIDLPIELDVQSIETVAKQTHDVDSVMRDWRIVEADGGRRLILHFSQPIRGEWHFWCEFRPRLAFGPAFTLPFPAAQNAAASTRAWRSAGVGLIQAGQQGHRAATPEQFQTMFRTNLLADGGRSPNRAFVQVKGSAMSALRLRWAPKRPAAESVVAWTVGPNTADGEWAVQLTAGDEPLALVEWDLPTAIAITAVRGTDLAFWSRTGTRLQVWLTKSAAKANVDVQLSASRTADARFELPAVRLMGVTGNAVVRVQPHAGFVVTPGLTQQLEPIANPSAAILEYRATGTNPRGSFQVKPASSQ